MEETKTSLLPIALFSLVLIVASIFYGCEADSISQEYDCLHKYSNVQCSAACFNYSRVSCEEELRVNEEHAERYRENQKFNERRAECQKSGVHYNETFDIFEDYTYNCDKLEYINNHFIQKNDKKDVGYIRGSFSQGGLFSSGGGSIEGKFYQYVSSEILATGQLMRHISYCDLNDELFDVKTDYYDTGEFVMYYVDNCID